MNRKRWKSKIPGSVTIQDLKVGQSIMYYDYEIGWFVESKIISINCEDSICGSFCVESDKSTKTISFFDYKLPYSEPFPITWCFPNSIKYMKGYIHMVNAYHVRRYLKQTKDRLYSCNNVNIIDIKNSITTSSMSNNNKHQKLVQFYKALRKLHMISDRGYFFLTESSTDGTTNTKKIEFKPDKTTIKAFGSKIYIEYNHESGNYVNILNKNITY